MQDLNQYSSAGNADSRGVSHRLPNFVAGDRADPLLPLENPLLQQAASFGEPGLATVIRLRPLSRAVFSYLQASGLLAKPQVQDVLKAQARTADLVSALRVLSPQGILHAVYGGHVPKGLVLALGPVSETKGLNQHDATRVMSWMSPGSEADKQRGRLLLEAIETLKNNKVNPAQFDYSVLVANIDDLSEGSLSLLRLREVKTANELTQKAGGAQAFEFTINYLASVCSSFEQLKVQISQDLRAGKPLGRVLRQILEDHADALPKPRFPAGAALLVLEPSQALQLSIDWQNCIRETWMDNMLAGDISFVRSKACLLVARLKQVKGQDGQEMWLLEEIAAPGNEPVDAAKSSPFVLELQRGNVVVVPEQQHIRGFMKSVIGRYRFL
jgi:hypothetical protein